MCAQQTQGIGNSGDYAPSKGIYFETIQHVVWIHHIAQRFGHFLAVLVVDKAMGKDRLGKGNTGRHEQARPNDGMKPKNVLHTQKELQHMSAHGQAVKRANNKTIDPLLRTFPIMCTSAGQNFSSPSMLPSSLTPSALTPVK